MSDFALYVTLSIGILFIIIGWLLFAFQDFFEKTITDTDIKKKVDTPGFSGDFKKCYECKHSVVTGGDIECNCVGCLNHKFTKNWQIRNP